MATYCFLQQNVFSVTKKSKDVNQKFLKIQFYKKMAQNIFKNCQKFRKFQSIFVYLIFTKISIKTFSLKNLEKI